MHSLESLIKINLLEDIGTGDYSSLSCIEENIQGKAKLLVKEKGIIAGIDIAKKIFNTYDTSLSIEQLMNDGKEVNFGDTVFIIKGKVRSILATERLVLNVMQRMSGIATKTNSYCKIISDLNTKILDTRKTSPGLRILDKMAVKIGGGENHRMGLFDMIMLKDNHIDFAGGIEKAIKNANTYIKKNKLNIKIEIETRNLKEVKEVLTVGNIDRIMLDNFNINDTKIAVSIINNKYEIESSGNITKENIRDYALCNVNFISVGELTHSVKSLDLSLKAF